MTMKREKQGAAVRYLSDKPIANWRYDKKRGKWFTWGIDLTLSGGRVREKGFPSKAAAEDCAAILKVRDRELRFGFPQKTSTVTLRELFDKRLASIAERSRRALEMRVLDYFLSLTGNMTVSSVRRAHLYAFIERRGKDTTRRKTMVTPHTVNREMTIISAALHQASKLFPSLEDYQPPVIPRPRLSDTRRTRTTTKEERANLLEILTLPRTDAETVFYHGERLRTADALRFAWLTGARKKDIARLEWKDWQPDKNRLRVYHYKNKTESIFSPIPSRIAELLGERKTRSSGRFVFTDAGEFSKYFEAIIEKACVAAKIVYGRFAEDGFTFHSTRHDFISNLLRNNVDIETARELAGISKGEILLIYAHATDDSRRRAMQIIDEF